MGVVTGIGSTSCLVPLLYSIAIGEHLSTRDLLGFSLFFVGLMLFFTPNDQPGHGQKISTAAVSYSFLAALFYGIGIIVLDYGTHESLTGTLLMSMLPQMLLAGVGLERRKSHWNGLSFKSFSILILSGSALAIASMAFYAAANDGDINIGVASVIRSLNPIVIAFLARLILHEKMTQAEVFALGIVLLGTTFVLS
jgi:drug/metabolite transporter (DMT)-like permease